MTCCSKLQCNVLSLFSMQTDMHAKMLAIKCDWSDYSKPLLR